MTALLTPPEQTVAAPALPDPTRLLFLRANLIPPEVTASDTSRRTRRFVLLGLVVLVALLIAWDLSVRKTNASADERVVNAEQQIVQLSRQQRNYAEVVRVQNLATGLSAQLASLMAGDLLWYQVLPQLSAMAPSGVAIITAEGTTTASTGDGASAPAAAPSAAPSATAVVGKLTLTGTATTVSVLADYVDSLLTVKGLSDGFIASADTQNHLLHFTVQLSVTSDAYSYRFQVTPNAGTVR